MNCPTCHGTGKNRCKVLVGQGQEPPIELDMIDGPCLQCFGTGSLNCCEGDREQALVVVGELIDGTKITTDVNPNELA
jgi:hypothetical protein